MVRNIFRYELICITIFIFFASCKNNSQEVFPPQISFYSDDSTLYKDTAIGMGEMMKFKIRAHSNSSPITNLVVRVSGESKSVYLDSGLYASSIDYTLNMVKGPLTNETWEFTVMNKDRESSSVKINISLSNNSNFNPVFNISDLNIGAQNNNTYGSFLSFDSNRIYTLNEAYLNQSIVEFIYYYDVYEATLSSPNESDAPAIFTGAFGLSNWTTKNETRYLLTGLTENEFNSISNDSLVIASYNPTSAKRKGKNCVAGQVWSFGRQNGKLGLILIQSVDAGDTGHLQISMKIQP